MKAKYTGPHLNNWYGLNLTTGETYDIPENLETKVENNPDFKAATVKKKAVKKAVRK